MREKCSAPGCRRLARAKGFCYLHYQREIARVELFLSLAPQTRDGWIGRPSENSAPAHENSEQNASAWRHGVLSQSSWVAF